MKKLLFVLILGLALTGCTHLGDYNNSESDKNSAEQPVGNNDQPKGAEQPVVPTVEEQVTIKQGIYGIVKLWEGNCMPTTIEPGQAPTRSCGQTGMVNNEVKIRALSFYNQTKGELIKTVTTNEWGFYEAELPVGSYSVFVETKDKGEDCQGAGGQGEMCPATVKANTASLYNITVDRAVH